MPKEKISKTIKANIRNDVDSSTIPQMLKALFQLANGVEILSNQCFSRIKGVFANYGIFPDDNDILTGISQYCRQTKLATSQFFARIEPLIQGATFDIGEDKIKGADAYDAFSRNSSELIRFMLLLIDRCTNNTEAYRKVSKTLRQLPSNGIFKDEDFTRFKK